MNATNSCTATFNNIILKYEGRGFSKNTPAAKQQKAFVRGTLEEFDRYYTSRPGYAGYTPLSARAQASKPHAQTRTAAVRSNTAASSSCNYNHRARPAQMSTVEQKRPAAKAATRPERSEAKLPSRAKNEPSKVRRAVEKIADVSIGATRRNFRRLPAATLVTIVACMMSLILLVGSTVMTGDITNEYSELKSQVNALASEESKLATELDIKNDLRLIEDIAINKLGMVSRDLVVRNYVKLDEEDMIESFSEPEKNVGLSTLLSAIAGK